MSEQDLKDLNVATADENFDWFQENLPELVKKYDDRYVVIKNKSVIADYNSLDNAFVNTIKTEEPGTFIIQLCSLDPAKTTIVLSNMVSFE